jgi:chromosome segregation ATPase
MSTKADLRARETARLNERIEELLREVGWLKAKADTCESAIRRAYNYAIEDAAHMMEVQYNLGRVAEKIRELRKEKP